VVSEGSAACPGYVVSTHRSLVAASLACSRARGYLASTHPSQMGPDRVGPVACGPHPQATVLQWLPQGLGSYRDAPRWRQLYYASRGMGFKYLGHGLYTVYEGVTESVWAELPPEMQALKKQRRLERRREGRRLAEMERERRAQWAKDTGQRAYLPEPHVLTSEELARKAKRAKYAEHTARRKAEQLVEAREEAAWQAEKSAILAARPEPSAPKPAAVALAA